MNRRTFLAATTAAPAVLKGATGPRTALIGSGGRGRYLAGEFKELGAEVAAVCDVYEPNLAEGLKVASSGARPYSDYRRVLEDKSIEAVFIATPDHWHARMLIDSVEAGKDVYVEKPLCHTIDEGFAVIEAVRRTKRVVQVGTQRRSAPLFQESQCIAASGELGEIRLVSSWWLNHQSSLSERKLAGKLDWKQWLGSTPERPLDEKRFFNWYYYWDYSGGLLIGQAAHIMDAIQWYMNSREPVAVTCAAGPPNLQGAEVPETATLTVEFPQQYLATFTLGYKAMRYRPNNDQLKQFHGSKARLDVGREGYALYPESQEVEMKPVREVKRPGSFASATRDHIRNFFECIQTRRDPNAPVEAGQATNMVLVMAMESLRKQRRIRWNPALRRTES